MPFSFPTAMYSVQPLASNWSYKSGRIIWPEDWSDDRHYRLDEATFQTTIHIFINCTLLSDRFTFLSSDSLRANKIIFFPCRWWEAEEELVTINIGGVFDKSLTKRTIHQKIVIAFRIEGNRDFGKRFSLHLPSVWLVFCFDRVLIQPKAIYGRACGK